MEAPVHLGSSPRSTRTNLVDEVIEAHSYARCVG